MMLLRSLPDLSQVDSAFNQWFTSKWGRENCIIWGRVRFAEFGPQAHTLSIRAAWGGAEECQFNGRTVAVDDDNFLILNHGRVCARSIHATRPVESFTICFRPGLAEQTYGAMAASMERALSQGETIAERPVEFMENLQPHDQTVSPVLRFIKAHLLQGFDDEGWYEEQLIFLLERMQIHHMRTLEAVDGLRLVRAGTRREIFRRVRLATDFLHTNYARSFDLAALAKVAYMSKFHFLRAFTLVHGLTPFAYLQNKRLCVALRLLESTQLTVGEVASSVGFTTRSALLRQIRRGTGLAPLQIRNHIGVCLT
jgi:AraC-like DNA-binding protein